LLAIGLWVYVITVERPESENTFYNVPVVLEGEDVLRERGMMITSQTQQTVTLKLSGNRKALNQLKSSDIAAVIDLSRVTEAGEKNATYSVEIPGDADLEVVARQPESVALIITEWATKEIPVSLDFIGRVPEGYYVDKQSATLDRTSVHVTGPEQIITQIEKAVITIDGDEYDISVKPFALRGTSQIFRLGEQAAVIDFPKKGEPTVTVDGVQVARK
jgi:YbbR domain-containing protein